ncbi:MAG: hypothetical protein LIR46_07985 [Bacteroidota bacterium]|nr:hypothetical protein [Bacteroidota bacterium]
MMNSFFNLLNNPMMSFLQQVRQNPNMLSNILRQRGIINDVQAEEIQKMGCNYEQIGQYLIQNGIMPNNIRQFEGQVNQVQNMMNEKSN